MITATRIAAIAALTASVGAHLGFGLTLGGSAVEIEGGTVGASAVVGTFQDMVAGTLRPQTTAPMQDVDLPDLQPTETTETTQPQSTLTAATVLPKIERTQPLRSPAQKIQQVKLDPSQTTLATLSPVVQSLEPVQEATLETVTPQTLTTLESTKVVKSEPQETRETVLQTPEPPKITATKPPKPDPVKKVETTRAAGNSDISAQKGSQTTKPDSKTASTATGTAKSANQAAGTAAKSNYAGQVRRCIERAVPSRGSARAAQPVSIRFTMSDKGRVSQAEIVRSSGNKRYDRDVLTKVKRARRCKAPMAGDKRVFTINFKAR